MSEEEAVSREMIHHEKVREIQHENHQLHCLVTKMVTMNRWKSNHDNQIHGNLINLLKKKESLSKKK